MIGIIFQINDLNIQMGLVNSLMNYIQKMCNSHVLEFIATDTYYETM